VAREELDRVVGPDRLPAMDDDLPFIRCCVKETLRWMPTTILGVQHAVIRDDEYMCYKIPKGAAIMLNVWCVVNQPTSHSPLFLFLSIPNTLDHRVLGVQKRNQEDEPPPFHFTGEPSSLPITNTSLSSSRTINTDPKRHAHPRVFDPSRCMAGNTQTAAEATVVADPSKRDHFTFGAGRRVYQGMHIAEWSLFLAIARLLWGFEFGRAVVAPGGGRRDEEVVPDADDLAPGFLVQPWPFPARIAPRTAAHARLIRNASAGCQDLLDEGLQWKEIPEGMPFSTLAGGEEEDEKGYD
jgi:hypothetical protein